MLEFKYKNDKTKYKVEFSRISAHVVQLLGEFPIDGKGFVLSREEKEDGWDYSGYTTVYRKVEGGVQFSDDGSVYVAPVQPPEPEPYVPTLEEVQEEKINEMNAAQQAIIQQGIDITLTDGTTEHFTLTDQDQTSLMGLQTKVVQGAEQIPWHTSDQSEHCKYYTNADMALIVEQAMQFVTFHVTYFRDLRIYIRSLSDKEEIEAVSYGIIIPEEYRSDPLKDMYMVMQEG